MPEPLEFQIARSLAERRAQAAQAQQAEATTQIIDHNSSLASDADKGGELSFKALGVDDLGVITGIGGAIGNVSKLDLDGEFIRKGDLIKMAFDFCSSDKRTFKANHRSELAADLVESWVGAPIIKDGDGLRTLKASETLTDEMVVVGINTEKGNESHWFVGVRPHDPKIVELARKGGVAGFSWGAHVTKTELG